MQQFRPAFADTLAAITASLVNEPDVATVLGLVTDACTTVLDATSTGVLLSDPRGGLEVMAASDEPAMLIEVLQASTEQGPCVDCIRDNTVISELDLTRAQERWPQFVPAALSADYQAVIAVPMRLRGRPIGGLNLLYTRTLNDAVLAEASWPLSLARALADLSVLALVQDRGEHREERLLEHTVATLNDRIHLSQATGMVAAATGLDPHQARRAIRGYAHRTQRPLPVIVRAITDHEVDPTQLAATTAVSDTDPDA